MRLARTMTRASPNGLTQPRVEKYDGSLLGWFLITQDEQTGDPQGGTFPALSNNGKHIPSLRSPQR